MLIFAEHYPTTIFGKEAVFVTICVLVFASIPLNLTGSRALISKIVPAEKQGLVQGTYTAVTKLALIAGPILGGFVYSSRRCYGVIMAMLYVAGIGALTLAMPRIQEKGRQIANS